MSKMRTVCLHEDYDPKVFHTIMIPVEKASSVLIFGGKTYVYDRRDPDGVMVYHLCIPFNLDSDSSVEKFPSSEG